MTKHVLTALVIFTPFAMVGCDSNDVETTEFESEVSEIRIFPDSAILEVEDQVDFSFVALSEAGDTVRDVNFEINWWSTDSTVFKVEDDGRAIAGEPGTAYCMIEVTELAKLAPFTGKDSAFVTVRQF